MKLSPLALATVFLILGCAKLEKKVEDQIDRPKEAVLQSILQSIIDHNSLQPFWHSERKGRKPLVASDHLIGTKFKLKKFGENVKIVADDKIKGAYFRITHLECREGSYCQINFEYPVEGVVGKTEVQIGENKAYRFKSFWLSER